MIGIGGGRRSPPEGRGDAGVSNGGSFHGRNEGGGLGGGRGALGRLNAAEWKGSDEDSLMVCQEEVQAPVLGASEAEVENDVRDISGGRGSAGWRYAAERRGGMLSSEFLGEDACMACHEEVQAPVLGASEAGRGCKDSLLHMETDVEIGGHDAGINNDMVERVHRGGTRDLDGSGEGWNGPVLGNFCMGSEQCNGLMGAACLQGVRSFAQPRKSDKGILGGPPREGANVKNRPSSAWGRPAVIPLPGRHELGEDTAMGGRVQLDKEEVFATVKRFDAALVGRLFGCRMSFDYLNTELHRRWSSFGKFRLVTMSGDCFVCFFDTIESRDAVLVSGPWIVAGQVVGVDCWSPTFSPASKAGFITPVWVRLHGLPMYCWGGKNIARIAGILGEPAWMDAATDRLEHGHYARVCIRMDLSKPLKPGMWIDGPFGSFFQTVEYEGLASFCFQCGHVGHKAEWCKMKVDARVRKDCAEVNGNQEVHGNSSAVDGECIGMMCDKPVDETCNVRKCDQHAVEENGRSDGIGKINENGACDGVQSFIEE